MHSVAPPPKDPLTEPGPWNAVAAGYDSVCFGQLPELTDAAIELLAPERDDRVLDIATGPGTLAVRLAPRVKRVVAVDFADAMLARLRGHIMQQHLANVEARVMNGEQLEFTDGTFDAAVSLFGVFLFDDRARGLAEMFRVVVPGGKALFSSWAAPEQNTMIGAGMAALRSALPQLPRPQGPLPTQQPEVCAAELEATGFERVTTRLFKKSVSYRSVADYWSDFERAAAPLVVLKKKLGDAAFADAMTRAQVLLSESHGSGAFSLDCAAIFTFGERPLSAA
jgi:ubiquinone/menaquinone biosynthesis C-methylase UbiE